jgi:hypothetical protein
MEIPRRSFLGFMAATSPIALGVPNEGGAANSSGRAYADVPTYPVFSQADIAKALRGDELSRRRGV